MGGAFWGEMRKIHLLVGFSAPLYLRKDTDYIKFIYYNYIFLYVQGVFRSIDPKICNFRFFSSLRIFHFIMIIGSASLRYIRSEFRVHFKHKARGRVLCDKNTLVPTWQNSPARYKTRPVLASLGRWFLRGARSVFVGRF